MIYVKSIFRIIGCLGGMIIKDCNFTLIMFIIAEILELTKKLKDERCYVIENRKNTGV